jgi:hypothetical protein
MPSLLVITVNAIGIVVCVVTTAIERPSNG